MPQLVELGGARPQQVARAIRASSHSGVSHEKALYVGQKLLRSAQRQNAQMGMLGHRTMNPDLVLQQCNDVIEIWAPRCKLPPHIQNWHCHISGLYPAIFQLG